MRGKGFGMHCAGYAIYEVSHRYTLFLAFVCSRARANAEYGIAMGENWERLMQYCIYFTGVPFFLSHHTASKQC